MSVSKRKRKANRANAQKSTGAVTPAGRAAVSTNAIKHGLTGCFRVLVTESQEQFDLLLEQFLEAEQPVGGVEVQLVRKMAEHTWMSARCVRAQEGCITATQTPEQKAQGLCATSVNLEIERYLRYQAAHDRAYQRASKELRERRKERQLAARGFVSQKHQEAQEARQAELHPHKVAAAKAGAQHAESRATMASIKTAEKITSFIPPEAAAAWANGGLPALSRR